MNETPDAVQSGAARIAAREIVHIRVRTNRMFAWLLGVQFVVGVLGAIFLTPRTWSGPTASVHAHVLGAIVVGATIAAVPIALAIRRPDRYLTQHVVGVAQVMFSALFIHITGGRIETHFHVFGSLAILTFYRDWRTLIAPTLAVAVDHLARGMFWPESVFGVLKAAPWRALEHAAWLLFEDAFLVYCCIVARRDLLALAQHQHRLELERTRIESQVQERTRELETSLAALKKETAEREKLQVQLMQASKMESVGQLAAGIAHEINTPAQFIGDNTRFAREEIGRLILLCERYGACLHAEERTSRAERAAEIEALLEEIDYEFLKVELPDSLEQSLEGIERISHIVSAMRDFSHPGVKEGEPADLNAAIRSSATVCTNRWKYVADLEMDLDPNLPDVPCLVDQFNQVVLNLIVNAADAINSRHGGHGRGQIVVRTRVEDEDAVVEVVDDGGGIPDEITGKVFDPFFTTKPVGEGTGQGLAICHDIVVNKHKGTLTFSVERGVGTTFTVRLPIGGQESLRAA